MTKVTPVIVALILAGCVSPVEQETAASRTLDAQRTARQRAYRVTPEVQASRDRLTREYQTLLSNLFPQLNGIQVKFFPNVYGPEWGFLHGEHSMFTPYTVDIAPAGPAVQRWMAANRSELAKARITEVGVGLGNAAYPTGSLPPQ